MVANDNFDGKATHLNCFFMHLNFEQKYPKPAMYSGWCNEGLCIYQLYLSIDGRHLFIWNLEIGQPQISSVLDNPTFDELVGGINIILE